VDPGIIFPGMSEGISKHPVLEEKAVLDGKAHAGIVLIDDLAGAQGEVSHFGVSFFVPGKTDGDAGSLKRPSQVIVLDVVDIRGADDMNRIGSIISPDTPAIKNHKDDGLLSHSG